MWRFTQSRVVTRKDIASVVKVKCDLEKKNKKTMKIYRILNSKKNSILCILVYKLYYESDHFNEYLP